jgi:hypothetical protein
MKYMSNEEFVEKISWSVGETETNVYMDFLAVNLRRYLLQHINFILFAYFLDTV